MSPFSHDMNREPRPTPWQREELLQLLSLASNLAGLSITGVTLFYTVGRVSTVQSVADDMLVVCALLFLFCAYLIFVVLRQRESALRQRLERIADALFLGGMTLMVATGMVMAYTIW